jgi:hypothetical protein
MQRPHVGLRARQQALLLVVKLLALLVDGVIQRQG